MNNTEHNRPNRYAIEQMERTIAGLKEDMERLRDIPGMPEEAINILREWTIRDEDEQFADA